MKIHMYDHDDYGLTVGVCGHKEPSQPDHIDELNEPFVFVMNDVTCKDCLNSIIYDGNRAQERLEQLLSQETS